MLDAIRDSKFVWKWEWMGLYVCYCGGVYIYSNVQVFVWDQDVRIKCHKIGKDTEKKRPTRESCKDWPKENEILDSG